VDEGYLRPFLDRPRGFCNHIRASSPVGRIVTEKVTRMTEEAAGGRTDRRLALKTLLRDALFEIQRHCAGAGPRSSDAQTRRHDVLKLEPVFDYIRQHHAERLTGPGLARVASLSPAYFSRLFHRLTGTTVTGYITRYRVDKAKELLAEGRLSTAQVGMAVGFESESYFYRSFRSVMKMTPKTYRQKIADL
jgi:AraC-like DNA-binding protein